MKKILKWVLIFMRNRGKKVRIGSNCNINLKAHFEGMNVIRNGAIINGSIGYGTYVGERSVLFGIVGRFCSLGADIKIVIGTHPSKIFVSTHPAFFSLLKQNGETFVTTQKFEELNFADDEGNCILIGNDVWIGSNATLYSGITVGNGAIIAAGAIVTKDVEPYSIVGGIPAKIIRMRFNSNQIIELEKIEWWNKPVEWIKDKAEYFDDIDEFIQVVKNGGD